MQNHSCDNEFHLNWPFAAVQSRRTKTEETHRGEITKCLSFSPLGPKSDQYKLSPDNINTSSRGRLGETVRINKMVTKGKML